MWRSALGLVSFGFAVSVMATACSSAQEGNCPVGTYPDAATGGCIQTGGGQCPPGMVFNGAQCVAGGGACPPGQQWNGSMCAPAAPQCPPGTTPQNGQCMPGGAGNPFGGSSCSPAQQVDPTFAAAGLNVIALQQAPGAQAVSGAALAGNFQAGQCLEVQVQLDPAKCYTAIGQGAPSELDVQLVAPLPGPFAQAFAQDNMQGSTAILGGSGNCFRPVGLFALPAKLVIKANAGAGPAAVQLYAK